MFKSLLLVITMLLFVPTTSQAQSAPEFTLKDHYGETVSLSDFKGKPLIIHFWATWCPYCKKVQPGLSALHEKFKDQGLGLIGINFREDDGSQPQMVLSHRGHKFTTLAEGDAIAKAYGITSVPTTIFIDRDGNITAVTNTASPNDPELTELAEKIIGE